ncbi:MAG: thiamine diphosphokinase [Elusimicrobium sp.]|uniref:Thiamine diphosphokinase n=1 Tax=Candidatus Avelusimicrobium gallicola TaxID=2562704 RepID=A0A928HIV2_9BACT|nr:thiamine diphosphokinase [Elusimicrobium sp.]
MKFTHTLLIGNGETLPAKTLKELAQKADFVLAADGGANRALACKVTPDLVIGDLDSVSPSTQKKLSSEKILFVDNQNNTDLEKALDYLSQNGCKSCTVAGFAGGRLDFTLGNFLSVYPYLKKMDICLWGNGWTIYPITADKKFNTEKGARVSLIPLKNCTGVTLKGLKFPLQKARLSWQRAGRTLSNEATGKTFSVQLESGFMLVYVEQHPGGCA